MDTERGLFFRVATAEALADEWEDILDRGDAEEQLSESVSRFAANADENLAVLLSQLLDGTYAPGHLHEILIPKKSGDFRSLAVPRVRDRVVERAILDAITPHVDPWLGVASYAYRPGLGVADAVQQIVRLRDEGLRWVLRADVEDCFGTVPRDLALRLVSKILPDESLTRILGRLTERRVMTRHGLRETQGLPQGTALSPIMANLVVRPVFS